MFRDMPKHSNLSTNHHFKVRPIISYFPSYFGGYVDISCPLIVCDLQESSMGFSFECTNLLFRLFLQGPGFTYIFSYIYNSIRHYYDICSKVTVAL